MIEDWKKVNFVDSIVKNNVGRSNQINASEILEIGEYPVIDQGQSFIAGYCNDSEKIIRKGLPFVIFGDHTRCFKFVDFPFVIGADGTKVLSPNTDLFDSKFFYFQLISLDIQNRGYNRHFKILKEKVLNRPDYPEQRKISYVLGTVQKAIEKQDRLIKTTTELKKALMQKLFTEGLYGEPQKETEIGLVPESWEVVKIGDYLEKTKLKDPTKEPDQEFIYVDVSSVSNEFFRIENTSKLLGKEAPSRARKLIQTRDVIFATVRPTLKRIAKIEEEFNNQVCSTGYCVLKPKHNELNQEYLYQYLQTDKFIGRIEKLQRGASYPAVRDTDVKNMLIPFPKVTDQQRIGLALNVFDKKIEFHENKKQTLTSLFKTLLHELMTGQRRVHEINFEKQKEEMLMAAEPEMKYKK